MSLISFSFLIFVFLTLIIYYLMPKRFQWLVLLASSLLFYCLGGVKSVIFVLITSASTFTAARLINRSADAQKKYIKEHRAELTKEQKDEYKKNCASERKYVLATALILNFGILCVFKYTHFALGQLNALVSSFGGTPIEDTLEFIIPLGISFYTFQSMGYLLDVYWGKTEAEKCFGRMLLFVSFFPQIIQGPISAYSQLSKELFTEHEFTMRNFSWGFQRLLWGLFKKMVIANAFAPLADELFASYKDYSAVSLWLGVAVYCLRLYADFSGYMDISCGVCEMLGITLTENFDRPFFSKSISEFWRRWHITLGAWFKNYIFFPVAVSKWNNKLSNNATKKLGKHIGQSVLATIPLTAVWFLTGLWHGASWTYIVWGLANGVVIIFSLWMKPVYARCKELLHISDDAKWWQGFQMLRTCMLFGFIEIFPEVGTFADGLGFWKRMLTEFNMKLSVYGLLPFWKAGDRTSLYFAVFGCILMLAVSLIQNKRPARELFNRLPAAVRIIALAALFVIIASIGVRASAGMDVFMYANF